jgi:hypothetical protein
MRFEDLNPWQKADYLDLEHHLKNTTPAQRVQWLEEAFDFALQVALERRARGEVTLDSDGEVWPSLG